MAYSDFSLAETAALYRPRQAWFRKLRDNFIDHESRLAARELYSHDAIHTHFGCAGNASDLFTDFSGSSSAFTYMEGGRHVLRMSTSGSTARAIAAADGRMRFKLIQDQTVEFRAWIGAMAGASVTFFIGFQDDSIATAAGQLTDISDCIGFILGTNANTYKFRTAKASTATEQDNVGNRSIMNELKINVARVGGVATVRAYHGSVPPTEIGGSPFTANIPDGVVLRPVIQISGSGTPSIDVDRLDVDWTVRPDVP